MPHKKRKRNGLGTTFGLAGASIGMGMAGKAVGSEAIEGAGATSAKFVPVSANISGAGMTLGMLKNLKK